MHECAAYMYCTVFVLSLFIIKVFELVFSMLAQQLIHRARELQCTVIVACTRAVLLLALDSNKHVTTVLFYSTSRTASAIIRQYKYAVSRLVLHFILQVNAVVTAMCVYKIIQVHA